jgi:hypothetical protein
LPSQASNDCRHRERSDAIQEIVERPKFCRHRERTVDLIGNGPNFAALNVSGAITNNGSISIASDTEELAGAVSEALGKTGSFSLSGATTFNFVENSAGTGGTLTLTDGSLTANILMTGKYSNSSFTLAPDSGTGTLVSFV